ncbi:hypothetical protein H8356DRAFT_1387100 [Neocallimastix lanati (nom. inval.)]|nr:hypothetical protein H8356DRAFT_1387100 [Neocallimastix sp. JGI-2020a]
MILGIFIIGIVLNKIIALPQELKSNNKASVWIYNEYLNSCLYASGYSDEPITYDYCNNSIDNKWYIGEDDDGIYFMSATDKEFCISYVDDQIKLAKCDENAIMKYDEVSKFIKSDNMCVSAIDDLSDEEFLRLTKCDRHNKKIFWEISYKKPTKKINTTTTTTTTTTINPTPTSKPMWIYNEYTEKCLYAPDYEDEIPTYEKCDNTDNYQWYVVSTKGGTFFKSKSNLDLCLRVSNNDNSKIMMGECDTNAILRYRRNDGTITSKLSESLCLGNSISSSIKVAAKIRNKVKLYDCDDEINEDQIWMMLNSNPAKKFTTTTTTTTTTTSTTTTTTINITTTTKSPSPTIDTKYRCGKDFNNKSCSKGECCSKYGYCGTSIDHCGTGCQASYGRCNDGGRCGTDYGKCLNDKQCCSQFGYCDISDAHCGSKCQSKFGLCYGSDDRCGEKYGRCKGNKCCSKWGYCGTSSDHCKKGCQPKYGLCK